MTKEHSNDKFVAQTTRIDKTLQWFATSRDSWKEKTKESKTKLKTTTLALRRARENRDQFESELAEARRNAKTQLKQKDAEITMLKDQLEQLNQEIEVLKKKR